jgi:hypothetical protein
MTYPPDFYLSNQLAMFNTLADRRAQIFIQVKAAPRPKTGCSSMKYLTVSL